MDPFMMCQYDYSDYSVVTKTVLSFSIRILEIEDYFYGHVHD